MNKKFFTALAMTVVVTMPVMYAMAQTSGVRGGDQQQDGRFRQQGRQRPGGMMRGGAPLSMIVNRDDVQKDLKLSNDQKSKLRALQESMREEMQSMFQNGGGGGDRQAMMDQMRKMQEDHEKKVLAVLTDAQTKRLKQIALQLGGPRALMSEETKKALKITPAQAKKMEDAAQKHQEANRALFQKMRDGSVDREQGNAAREKNDKALEKALMDILTAEQKKQLTEMKGEPFKADPNERGGFGFGGPGGPGGGGRGQGGRGSTGGGF